MDLPIVIIVFVTVFLLILFFGKKTIIKRRLKKAELKRLLEFIDGDIAKIVGNVEFIGDGLIAPLSGRKCAYYYVHVEQQVSSGKSSHWKTIIEENVVDKFVIRDGVDYAYINDRNVKSYIVQDRNYKSGLFNDATQQLENYLHIKGYESENMLGLNKTLRYKEGVLEEGEEIAVFGKGEWKDVDSLNLPEKYRRVLEITSTNEEAIYLSDDPDTTKATAKMKSKKNTTNNYKQNDNRYFQKTTDKRFYQK